MDIERLLPAEIETRSFEIIALELQQMGLSIDPQLAPIILRAIHTSADFDYARALEFSPDVVPRAIAVLKAGATIITDTNMALSGINKPALRALGCAAHCFVAADDVALSAKREGATRSSIAMQKAGGLPGPKIFAIGNAPTALIELDRLMRENIVKPELIIGAPVGFVNVVQSKELIIQSTAPYIVARGRKGGSPIAAAIVNALMYMALA